MKNQNNLNLAIALLILLVVACACPKNDNQNDRAAAPPSANTSNTPAKTPVTAKSTPEATKDTAGVTIENFNKLKTGMRYEDVVKILGSEGTVVSENEIGGYKTTMYQWKGGYVANMNCMFQNGKLMSKAQFGLD